MWVVRGHEHIQEAHGAVETTGERIYSICYRKVRIKTSKRQSGTGSGGGGAKLTLQRGNLWKGSIRSLGLASDEIIEANIEDTDDIKDRVPAGHGFTIPQEFWICKDQC